MKHIDRDQSASSTPAVRPPSAPVPPDGPHRDERAALRFKADALEEELERAAQEILDEEERSEKLDHIERELAATRAQLDRLAGDLSTVEPRPWWRRRRPSKRLLLASLGAGVIVLGAAAGVAWATGALDADPEPRAAEHRCGDDHEATRHGQRGPGMCGQQWRNCSSRESGQADQAGAQERDVEQGEPVPSP